MARPKPVLIGLLLAAVLAPLGAAPDRAVTLDEAVSRALSVHPAVLQAQKEVDAARGRTLQLAAIPNPELSFEAAGLPLWNSEGEKEFSLGVRQLIEFPGKRATRREIGRAGEDQAATELDRVRNIVRNRVERAYFRAAYSERRLADLQSILVTLREYTDLAVERYKSGQVPYLDVIRGRLETLRLQNEIVEAGRELKDKAIALNYLLGGAGYEPMTFSTEISFTPLAKTWDELKAAALAGPALRAQDTLRRRAELSLSLARKTRLPDFMVGLFTPSKRLGGWGFEFGMTLPLRRGEYRGAVLEAGAVSDQVSIERDAKARRILAALERSFGDAQALEEQIALFRDSLLRDVNESLKASLDSYQYGKSDALSVLDIVRSLKESRSEFLRALLNHRLTLIDIAAAGTDEGLGLDDVE